MRQRARPDLWEPGEGDFPGPPDWCQGRRQPDGWSRHTVGFNVQWV